MAFAQHTNTDIDHGKDHLPILRGAFRNKQTDVLFEYAERFEWDRDHLWGDYAHRIYVNGGHETRVARILGTVAYVVVDEDADGEAIVEKWAIKAHVRYDTTWMKGERA